MNKWFKQNCLFQENKNILFEKLGANCNSPIFALPKKRKRFEIP